MVQAREYSKLVMTLPMVPAFVICTVQVCGCALSSARAPPDGARAFVLTFMDLHAVLRAGRYEFSHVYRYGYLNAQFLVAAGGQLAIVQATAVQRTLRFVGFLFAGLVLWFFAQVMTAFMASTDAQVRDSACVRRGSPCLSQVLPPPSPGVHSCCLVAMCWGK